MKTFLLFLSLGQILIQGQHRGDPVISVHPQNASVSEGSPVNFSVTASGTGALSYQWRKDHAIIQGATSSTYSIPSAALADEADYYVVVQDDYGKIRSQEATLTVAEITLNIDTHPQSQTVTEGSSATFTVAVTGTEPITYQWRKDSVDIAGETATSYTINSVALSDAGSYDCVVTDPSGTLTSNVATLTVNAAGGSLSIDTQPYFDWTKEISPGVVWEGEKLRVRLAASGTGTLSYQWRLNGVNRAGATGVYYDIFPASAADEGEWDCVVTDDNGSLTSSPAILLDVTSMTQAGQVAPAVGTLVPTTMGTLAANGWTDISTPATLLHIDPTAVAGGDGTLGNPYNNYQEAYDTIPDNTATWILFKRGTTAEYTNDSTGTLTTVNKSGASPTQPIYIGAYGSGPRPIINFVFRATSTESDFWAWRDLHFKSKKDGAGNTTQEAGIRNLDGGGNWLAEGCKFSNGAACMIWQNIYDDGHRPSNLYLRRCEIVDAFNSGQHSQGIFVNGTDGIYIEGCVFDQNGWDAENEFDSSDVFSHGGYITGWNENCDFLNTIWSRSSANGLQARSGGRVVDNYFLNNSFGLNWGHNQSMGHAQGVTGHVAYCIFEGSDNGEIGVGIGDALRGTAVQLGNIDSGIWHSNIILPADDGNLGGNNGYSIALDLVSNTWPKDVGLHDWQWTGTNIVYDRERPLTTNWGTDDPNDVTNTSITGLVISLPTVAWDGSWVILRTYQPFNPATWDSNTFWAANSTPADEFGYGATPGDNSFTDMDFDTWAANVGGVTNTTRTQPTFTDPDRNVAKYMTSLGHDLTGLSDNEVIDLFITNAADGCDRTIRTTLDWAYEADNVVDYVMAGFGVSRD